MLNRPRSVAPIDLEQLEDEIEAIPLFRGVCVFGMCMHMEMINICGILTQILVESSAGAGAASSISAGGWLAAELQATHQGPARGRLPLLLPAGAAPIGAPST